MKKIRINELARELEVKSKEIIDALPAMGITEKLTHSSSLDDDLIYKIRKHFGFEVGEPPAPSAEPRHRTEETHREPEHVKAPAEKFMTAVAEAPVAEEEVQPRPEPLPAAAPVAAPPPGPVKPKPIRPPLAGHRVEPPAPTPVVTPEPAARVSVPAAPPPPPAPAPTQPVTAEPAAPVAHAAPGTPSVPAAPAHRAPAMPPPQSRTGVSVPARPAPPMPRPGQILSGPRAPLPSDLAKPPAAPPPQAPPPVPPSPAPGAPVAVASPGVPRQAPSLPRPAGPRAPSLPPSGGALPPRQPNRPNLVGQPAARPVVPPRPDLVAKLTQTQPKAAPGQPAPRPTAMPGRPSQSPVPGQPIYRGPIRPGQPVMRGPGMPGPAGPGGGRGPQLRGRPMHPTAPLPPPGPVPDQRRPKPKGHAPREREEQEGKLKIGPRRSAPSALPVIDREITVSEGITVKELSEKLGVKANLVIKKLVEKKVFATINQALDGKLAETVAREFGASINKISYEEESAQDIVQAEVETDRVVRPPVVTIMGHVDHGKTSLLDAIRLSNVAEHEAGGITQHIGAYHVEKNGRKVVFIDTPGHSAFTRMRARGAKVTDIVVLVVAADDGVMPQTLEAIDHAKAAKVPIIVAINKIDKPGAQPERIKQQLSDRGLLAEDWGGDVIMVPVSAKQKTNLDLLLEMILLVADLQELKANPDRPAVGTVLEAQLDRGRGPVATVLVHNGTLRNGDYFICGSVFSKVRAMYDDRGNAIKEAGPSMPVEVLGLDSLPEVGDTFQVVTDTAKAKQIVIYRESKEREAALAKSSRMTLDKLHEQLREGEVKELNIILKADVGGSAEVLSDTLQKQSTDKVRIRVLRSGVGAINEDDVLLASASNAVIVGFNVRPERSAVSLAEQEKVDIRLHTIIYEVVDEIKRAMTGMLEPVFKEVYRGRAVVRDVFRITKVGTVAGCLVQDGVLTRDSQVRLLRDNVVIFTGRVESLKRFKNDASEVKQGFECGVGIANYNDIKVDDVIEAFATERVAPELIA
jgi:translation initiation factor IF-2